MTPLKAIFCVIFGVSVLLSGCGRGSSSGQTPKIWRNAQPEDIMAAEAVALADAQRNLARRLYAEQLFSGVDIFSPDPKLEERMSGLALKGYTELSRDYLPEGIVILRIKEAASAGWGEGYGALPGEGVESLKRRLVARTDWEGKLAAFLGRLRISDKATLAERCRGNEALCAKIAVLLPVCDRISGLTTIAWGKDEVSIDSTLKPNALAEEISKIMKPCGGPDAETLKSLNPDLQKDVVIRGSSKAEAPEGIGAAGGFSPSSLFKGAIADFKRAMDKINGAKTEVLK